MSKEYMKTYYQSNKEKIKEKRKEYYQEHKKQQLKKNKEYNQKDKNSLGKTKNNIRGQSNYYLKKHGKKIKGYEIHHCFSYTEPHKFIYCSKEIHNIIHSYLREHKIDADSNHYEQIKHLLDDTVVLYGIE